MFPLTESLGHSEATQSMSVAIALNIEPKGQRQDQDQGLKYYKLVKMGYDWQFRNSHRAWDESRAKLCGWSYLV